MSALFCRQKVKVFEWIWFSLHHVSSVSWMDFCVTSEPDVSESLGQWARVQKQQIFQIVASHAICRWSELGTDRENRDFPRKKKQDKIKTRELVLMINVPSSLATGCLVVWSCPFAYSLSAVKLRITANYANSAGICDGMPKSIKWRFKKKSTFPSSKLHCSTFHPSTFSAWPLTLYPSIPPYQCPSLPPSLHLSPSLSQTWAG